LVILIIAVAVLLLAAISGLVVWVASGIGWTLIHWLRLPFTLFEATLVSLISLVATTWLAWRLLAGFVTLPLSSSSAADEGDEDEWDEDNEDDEEDDEREEAQTVSSIPKWRQPIRNARDGFPIVDPDDRCPCGSGRKYKNCHGRRK
jgi:flagellar basal body-associated protein FliL